MKKAILHFLSLFGLGIALAQNPADTVQLEEVVVWGAPTTDFSHGARVIPIKTSFSNSSLSNQIQANSSVHFKTYGNGQLATITMRGSSASQTAVLWNGIPANSPTLGQSDFSIWPTFFSDRMAVQKGNSSPLYGSDAIGGAVILDNSGFQKDSLLTLGIELGSFGWQQYQAKVLVSQSNFSSQTKLLFSNLTNDFTYKYPGTGEKITQQNAAVQNHGFDQKIGWEMGHQSFTANVAYVSNWRESQPSITSASTDELESNLLRSALMHRTAFGDFQLFNSVGWLDDETIFNDQDKTAAQTFSLTNQLMLAKGDWAFRVGQIYQHFRAESDNFENNLTDWRVNLNGSVSYNRENWGASLNLKQHLSENSQVLSPSLGGSVTLYKSGKLKIFHQGQITTGFRVPTLNDKFWIPGGNPDLKPERSRGLETGQTFEWNSENSSYSFSWDAFYNWVDNWILWLPSNQGFYAPINVLKVESRGLETSLKTSHATSSLTISSAWNYSFIRSTEESGAIAEKGNQLAYTPIHQATGSLGLNWNSFGLSVRGLYTSRRYTTLDNTDFDSVEGYFISDMIASKNWAIGGSWFLFEAGVYNVLNADYQNLKNHAMPCRNFTLKITSKF